MGWRGSLREKEVSIDDIDAHSLQFGGASGGIDGMNTSFKAGGFPEIDDFWANPVAPHGDKFYTGSLGEGEDFFGAPVFALGVGGIEAVDDGFPGV